MTTLKELLGNSGEKREQVVAAACKVLDQEVADKSGLSGAAIKAAFGVIKNIKAGFIPDVVNALLDDFLDAIQPMYAEAREQGVAPGEHLKANSSRVAEALLGITDARVARAERPIIKKTYAKLRPSAMKHVEAAMPRIGDLLETQLA